MTKRKIETLLHLTEIFPASCKAVSRCSTWNVKKKKRKFFDALSSYLQLQVTTDRPACVRGAFFRSRKSWDKMIYIWWCHSVTVCMCHCVFDKMIYIWWCHCVCVCVCDVFLIWWWVAKFCFRFFSSNYLFHSFFKQWLWWYLIDGHADHDLPSSGCSHCSH